MWGAQVSETLMLSSTTAMGWCLYRESWLSTRITLSSILSLTVYQMSACKNCSVNFFDLSKAVNSLKKFRNSLEFWLVHFMFRVCETLIYEINCSH